MLPAGGAYVKVTLLGHATVLVETGPMRILMDPVLQETAPIPPLRDPNPERLMPSEMRETIASFLEKQLLPHCAEALGQPHTLAARYRREGAVYGIEVIFRTTGTLR